MNGEATGTPVAYRDVLRLFERRAVPVDGTETVPLAGALGRVLAKDLQAQRDVPAFDNAAVDGIAFGWTPELGKGGTLHLKEGRSAAGHGFMGSVAVGEAVRILTGAPLPAGADTIVPNEACTISNQVVLVERMPAAGANRRSRGEDIVGGARLLARGTRLWPWHLAVAASLGLGELQVHRRVRVALFSTGDELLIPGAPWRPAGVYDANRPLLTALLSDLPIELIDYGIVPDDPVQVAATVDRSSGADVVISSGGASRGEEDHVAALLAGRGQLDFWRAAIRPGRPLALGAVGNRVFVALPGNPVAAAICFLRFVRPLLLGMAATSPGIVTGRMMKAGFRYGRNPARTELLRCRIVASDDGGEELHPVQRQGSAMLSTLLEADGIAEIEPGATDLQEGDNVAFLRWQDLGINH